MSWLQYRKSQRRGRTQSLAISIKATLTQLGGRGHIGLHATAVFRDVAQHVQLESQHTQFDIIPDSKDPQIINGTLFTILDRSTFYDFCQHALDHEVSHSFHLKDN